MVKALCSKAYYKRINIPSLSEGALVILSTPLLVDRTVDPSSYPGSLRLTLIMFIPRLRMRNLFNFRSHVDYVAYVAAALNCGRGSHVQHHYIMQVWR